MLETQEFIFEGMPLDITYDYTHFEKGSDDCAPVDSCTCIHAVTADDRNIIADFDREDLEKMVSQIEVFENEMRGS